MTTISARTVLLLVLPLLMAAGLASFDPSFRLPALIVAAVGAATTYLAGVGSQGGAWAERLPSTFKALRSGGSVPPAPEGAPDAVRAAWAELVRAAEVWESDRRKLDELSAAKKEVQSLRADVEAARDELAKYEHVSDDAVSVERTRLDELITNLEQALRDLQEGLENQTALSGDSATRIRELTSAVGEMGHQVEMLANSAEESSSAILEMTTTNDQMAHNIEELGTSVRESVASIEEMTFSIKEVAKNVDALSLTAEQTSSSMNEMDVSIDQVQSNANETARLSEEVARDAETGAEAILKTIGEIYRIKESSQEAVSVISNLGSRIDAIGQILNVIDEVAEQTNLLALNAAIIAAQAGEHGKGFAVVADEIKDLAERAGASTKEIADLIKTIQAESRNAIQAVERGAQNVDRGVQVSNDAERALKKILESSQKSTNMVRAIARATVEQAKGSKQVTDSIGRIAETVQQIAAATSEQARGSELIMNSGEKMRTIAQQVERSSQEQSRGGRQITQAIESISAMVHQLNSKYREQSRETEAALAIEPAMMQALKRQGVALQVLTPNVEDLKKALDGESSEADE